MPPGQDMMTPLPNVYRSSIEWSLKKKMIKKNFIIWSQKRSKFKESKFKNSTSRKTSSRILKHQNLPAVAVWSMYWMDYSNIEWSLKKKIENDISKVVKKLKWKTCPETGHFLLCPFIYHMICILLCICVVHGGLLYSLTDRAYSWA